jgi:hypothetical protein
VKRLALLLLVACGPKPAPSSGVTADDAIFYVRSNVADATVFVDGRFIGPISMVKAGIAVVPGHHRVEVRRDDYFARYVELDLKRAERKKLEINLAPVLP